MKRSGRIAALLVPALLPGLVVGLFHAPDEFGESALFSRWAADSPPRRRSVWISC